MMHRALTSTQRVRRIDSEDRAESPEPSSHRRGHSQLSQPLAVIRLVVKKRFAVLGNESIEIAATESIWHLVGDVTRDDAP